MYYHHPQSKDRKEQWTFGAVAKIAFGVPVFHDGMPRVEIQLNFLFQLSFPFFFFLKKGVLMYLFASHN